jgi:hypothetical protein
MVGLYACDNELKHTLTAASAPANRSTRPRFRQPTSYIIPLTNTAANANSGAGIRPRGCLKVPHILCLASPAFPDSWTLTIPRLALPLQLATLHFRALSDIRCAFWQRTINVSVLINMQERRCFTYIYVIVIIEWRRIEWRRVEGRSQQKVYTHTTQSMQLLAFQ